MGSKSFPSRGLDRRHAFGVQDLGFGVCRLAGWWSIPCFRLGLGCLTFSYMGCWRLRLLVPGELVFEGLYEFTSLLTKSYSVFLIGVFNFCTT